jgi:hypothetical protein
MLESKFYILGKWKLDTGESSRRLRDSVDVSANKSSGPWLRAKFISTLLRGGLDGIEGLPIGCARSAAFLSDCDKGSIAKLEEAGKKHRI